MGTAAPFVVDPRRRSFVPVPVDHPFPLQNLPYGVFRPRGGAPRPGAAIGDGIVDLAALEAAGLLPHVPGAALFARPRLNEFMAAGRPAWSAVRSRLAQLLDENEPTLRDDAVLRGRVFHEAADCEMLLPAEIGDYTDFYSSRDHATNVGVMFRGPENALMPNWLHLPVAYHGRASSIVVSGADVRRPRGQTIRDGAGQPDFGPSRLIDFELEVGFFVGPGNALGAPIPLEDAEDHVFGFVLVNDWSARDIQKWEYQPLGPFLAKNFATSISPWVVPIDALVPFRCDGPPQDPEPLPYLRSTGRRSFDIALEVSLQTPAMAAPQVISRSNFNFLYWDIRQQIAHHTITGCNLRPGDLLASGTISGPEKTSRGSLLELTWRGTEPIALASGEERRFLQDGDRLTISGWSAGDGFRVGFGDVTGVVLPAPTEEIR